MFDLKCSREWQELYQYYVDAGMSFKEADLLATQDIINATK